MVKSDVLILARPPDSFLGSLPLAVDTRASSFARTRSRTRMVCAWFSLLCFSLLSSVSWAIAGEEVEALFAQPDHVAEDVDGSIGDIVWLRVVGDMLG